MFKQNMIFPDKIFFNNLKGRLNRGHLEFIGTAKIVGYCWKVETGLKKFRFNVFATRAKKVKSELFRYEKNKPLFLKCRFIN